MKSWLTALVAVAALAPTIAQAQVNEDPLKKIAFDLAEIDGNGLYRFVEGKRPLTYEFCVPNERSLIQEIQTIDPTLILYLEGMSHRDCQVNQILAIGSTQQPNPREVLLKLASLEEITQIDPFSGE